MKMKGFLHVFVAILFVVATSAHAVGELHIFGWGGDSTNPELIKKFSKEYDVEVTITNYNSNEMALSKIRPGGHGFDIVFPTSSHMPIWISEGLLMETRPDQMEMLAFVTFRMCRKCGVTRYGSQAENTLCHGLGEVPEFR